MMVNPCLRWARVSTQWQTSSISKGISGRRMTSDPEATPEWRASQPAFRPMTSTTMARWWLAAVVWTLSSASVALATAVMKPKVRSEPQRSLSMVLGTPMQLMPRSAKGLAADMVPSPPMTTRASMPCSSMVVMQTSVMSR